MPINATEKNASQIIIINTCVSNLTDTVAAQETPTGSIGAFYFCAYLHNLHCCFKQISPADYADIADYIADNICRLSLIIIAYPTCIIMRSSTVSAAATFDGN